jgi:hypothetical protein
MEIDISAGLDTQSPNSLNIRPIILLSALPSKPIDLGVSVA